MTGAGAASGGPGAEGQVGQGERLSGGESRGLGAGAPVP